MALRDADAYGYAKFRSTLAETDCNCVLSDGTVLPVLIEDGGTKLYVEIEYRFYDPTKLPNFARFDLRPEEIERHKTEKAAADALAVARAHKLPGRNWLETREAAAAANARGLAGSSNYAAATQADIATGEAQYQREARARDDARAKHRSGRI
jgi:hypothetical protein